jgi:hypothetical protein
LLGALERTCVAIASGQEPTDKLIQMLIENGVLSEEVGRALYQQ